MSTVLDRLRSLLEECPQLEPDSARVNLLRFGPSSLDVEIVAYVRARDWKQFAEIQEGLLLRIMESIESTGVQIALPSQTILIDASTSNDASARASIRVTAPEKKPGDDAPAAKPAAKGAARSP
jgi:MscS family membrane protein